MTVTEMLELVREHCPELAKLIKLHETDPCINELAELAEHVLSYDAGFEAGASSSYQSGREDGYEDGYEDGCADRRNGTAYD